MADEHIYPIDRDAPWGQKIVGLVGQLRYIVNQLGHYDVDKPMFSRLHEALDVIDSAVTPEPIHPEILKERERVCKLLMAEIPGLQARESHDGGPSLQMLIEELMDKIRR